MSSRALIFAAVAVLASGTSSIAAPAAWFAPSAIKVFRNATPTATQSWDLAAAKNEVEACQLVLRSDVALTGVEVSASDFSRKGRSIKPALKKVEYVPVQDDKGFYPDPLPPLTPLDLQPGQAQPVWISVRVPKDAAPGVYKSTITVKSAGSVSKYPLSLKVWDFALPDTSSCTTAFGIYRPSIARLAGLPTAPDAGSIYARFGVDGESAAVKKLYAKYYEMLLDHRISAYCIPANLASQESDKYLNDPRMTSFMMPYTDDDASMKDVINHLIKGGWFKKGYYYPIDEPISKDAYDALNGVVDRLRKLEPDYRLVSPFYSNSDFGDKLSPFDTMIGKLNIWCPTSSYYDTWPASRSTMAARKNAGDSAWWYVACGPGAPYANFFVNMDAINHRILFWQQKKENIDGLLYWCTTYWEGCKNPWDSIRTFGEIYGDGSLLYPGSKIGSDEPVPSQRIEVIRDGIEDFDYFTLANQRIGPDAANQYISKAVKSMTEFEKDPIKLEQIRRQLGNDLEKATKEARSKM